MPEAENHVLPGATNDTWRTWLMTGAHRTPIDRRRMRGAHRGLKRMFVEGMHPGEDRPHAWKDFSGAMVRHAVDEAMRTLPAVDKQVVKLAYFGGYSNRAIADETGLTEGTVQRRLRRALAAISEHIQHGRTLGRRAMYALTLWLSSRWLTDATNHAVQAAAVAGVTVIILAQPGAPPSSSPAATPQVKATSSGQPHPVIPPVPSPTIPALAVPQAPAVQVPIAVPSPPPLPVKVSPPVQPPLRA